MFFHPPQNTTPDRNCPPIGGCPGLTYTTIGCIIVFNNNGGDNDSIKATLFIAAKNTPGEWQFMKILIIDDRQFVLDSPVKLFNIERPTTIISNL
jgi:hypothetical protein